MLWKNLQLCLLLIIIAGCSRLDLPISTTTHITQNADQQRSNTSNFQETTPDNQPLDQATASPLPTATEIPLPTQTIAPTWTPLPALGSYEDLVDSVLITGDSECRLPCWAGITPGLTTWDELIYRSDSIDDLVELSINEGIVDSPVGIINALSIFYSSDKPYESVRIRSSIGAKNIDEEMRVNFINVIIDNFAPASGDDPSVGLHLPERLSIKSVLSEYGIPNLVFLDTDLGVPEFPRVGLLIVLIYPENRFMIQYHRNAYVEGDYLYACEPGSIVDFRITDTREVFLSKIAISKALTLNQPYFYYASSFEDVIDTPIEDYFSDFLTSETDCLTLPIDAWRYMLGE